MSAREVTYSRHFGRAQTDGLLSEIQCLDVLKTMTTIAKTFLHDYDFQFIKTAKKDTRVDSNAASFVPEARLETKN